MFSLTKIHDRPKSKHMDLSPPSSNVKKKMTVQTLFDYSAVHYEPANPTSHDRR
jgi:hypothetical protein